MREKQKLLRIIITGSPGTGKSTIAPRLARKLGVPLVEIRKIALERGLKSRRNEVDLKKLAHSLAFLKREKGYVVEGHLACEIRLPADFVFVLRSRPEVMERRLSGRRYPRGKLRANILAELLDYCTQRVMKVYGRKPLELDTSSRSPAKCVLMMEKAIKQKKKKLDDIDYSEHLKSYLRLAR
jgi:adenylate kinase